MSRPDPHVGCHAIVLAAGAGSRFDGAKLLAPFRGRPLICWPVEAALAARVERVTVVLGSRADDVGNALQPLQDARLATIRCVDWREGLSASLRCGLASLPSDCRAALIFLGDMPNLKAALADQLLEKVLHGAPAAFPEYAGLPGHPVAVSSALFDPLNRLKGDRGARAILDNLDGVVKVPTDDPGCTQDIDTRDDLERVAQTLS